MCFGCFWFYSCERQKGDFSPVFCNWGFFFAVIIFLLVRRRRSGTALATRCWHVDMTWSCRIEATKPPRQLLLISLGPLSFQINFCCNYAASAFLSGPHCPHPGVWTTVFSCLFWAAAFAAYKVWHWVFLESNLEISVTWYCPVDWQPGLGVAAALDLLMSETKCVELYRLPARTANGVLNRISSRCSAMMRAGHFSACVWIVS